MLEFALWLAWVNLPAVMLTVLNVLMVVNLL